MLDYRSAIATEDIENLSLCVIYRKEDNGDLYVEKFKGEHMATRYRIDMFLGQFAMLDNPMLFDVSDNIIKAGEYCRVVPIDIVPFRV